MQPPGGTTPSSAMREKGRGLADLMGRDPLCRRIEVERKERYAQELREQMREQQARRDAAAAAGAQGCGSTPQRRPVRVASAPSPLPPGGGSCSSWSSAAAADAAASASSGSAVVDTMLASAAWRDQKEARLWHPPSPAPAWRRSVGELDEATVADKVAEFQDLVRGRLQAFEREQEHRWTQLEASLAARALALRIAGDEAMLRRLDEGLSGLRQELREIASGSTQVLRGEISELHGTLQQQHGHVRGLRAMLEEQQTELRRVRDMCSDAVEKCASLHEVSTGSSSEVQSLREQLRQMTERLGAEASSVDVLQKAARQQAEELRRDLDARLQHRLQASGFPLSPNSPALPSSSLQEALELGVPVAASPRPAGLPWPSASRGGWGGGATAAIAGSGRDAGTGTAGTGSGDAPDAPAWQPVVERLEAVSERHDRRLQVLAADIAELAELAGLQRVEHELSELARAHEDYRSQTTKMLGKLALRIEMVAPDAKRGGGGSLHAFIAPC